MPVWPFRRADVDPVAISWTAGRRIDFHTSAVESEKFTRNDPSRVMASIDTDDLVPR
jgi:hypothetical protein